MKKYLIYAFLILPFSLLAQSQQKIDHLDFPYNLNNDLHLKGTLVLYDKQSGKEESSKVSEIIYHIDKQKISKKKNLTNFHCIQVSYLDSTVFNSPLELSKKGMQWWSNDTIKGKKIKHKTQAISLPLFEGKKWTSYEGDKKEEVTCFTTSTSVKTPCGTFDAFGIESTIVVEETPDYQIVVKSKEFYNQKVGKISTITDTYVKFTAGKRIPLAKEEMYVVDYTGYKKAE